MILFVGNIMAGERDARAKERATLRRDQAIARIRQIHVLATSSATDEASRAQLAVAIVDIDSLWANFIVENNNLLEILSELDLLGEFSVNVEIETRALVVEAKALYKASQPTSAFSVGTVQQVSYEGIVDQASSSAEGSSKDCSAPYTPMAVTPMRLPEIPLPTFDGECQNWPAFRDMFGNMVANNDKIPNVTKFYYLVGCLHSDPQEVIKGFSISNESFTLAWDALIERYDKPRSATKMLTRRSLKSDIAWYKVLRVVVE
ncbi:uncharacterized protein LOC132953649 [Metopolophium dirhodum]|uniref:uncharacterized protein LOC132953649 n=1 Tax=Metopolophium dirhodum TaxID=44670 RepID=UPI00298FDDF8|nr:uncharacterized protein LOC132953649 [Metopolophium dirhodum]